MDKLWEVETLAEDARSLSYEDRKVLVFQQLLKNEVASHVPLVQTG